LEIISQQKKGKKVKLSQKRAANKLAIDNICAAYHGCGRLAFPPFNYINANKGLGEINHLSKNLRVFDHFQSILFTFHFKHLTDDTDDHIKVIKLIPLITLERVRAQRSGVATRKRAKNQDNSLI